MLCQLLDDQAKQCISSSWGNEKKFSFMSESLTAIAIKRLHKLKQHFSHRFFGVTSQPSLLMSQIASTVTKWHIILNIKEQYVLKGLLS